MLKKIILGVFIVFFTIGAFFIEIIDVNGNIIIGVKQKPKLEALFVKIDMAKESIDSNNTEVKNYNLAINMIGYLSIIKYINKNYRYIIYSDGKETIKEKSYWFKEPKEILK